MAKKKKEKAVDLKPTNISEEQLKAIQEIISPINNIQMELGRIASRKHILCHNIVDLQDKLQVVQKELEDQYGTVNINIQTGELLGTITWGFGRTINLDDMDSDSAWVSTSPTPSVTRDLVPQNNLNLRIQAIRDVKPPSDNAKIVDVVPVIEEDTKLQKSFNDIMNNVQSNKILTFGFLILVIVIIYLIRNQKILPRQVPAHHPGGAPDARPGAARRAPRHLPARPGGRGRVPDQRRG